MTIFEANTAFEAGAGITQPSVSELRNDVTRLLITEQEAQWRDAVVDRLEELVQLHEGWDGYRGKPVESGTAVFALKMLETTCSFDTPAPEIVPGSSGDLQIEWHTEQADIELHVIAPNRVSAWRAKAGEDSEGEELELTINFLTVAEWVKEISEPSVANSTAAA